MEHLDGRPPYDYRKRDNESKEIVPGKGNLSGGSADFGSICFWQGTKSDCSYPHCEQGSESNYLLLQEVWHIS